MTELMFLYCLLSSLYSIWMVNLDGWDSTGKKTKLVLPSLTVVSILREFHIPLCCMAVSQEVVLQIRTIVLELPASCITLLSEGNTVRPTHMGFFSITKVSTCYNDDTKLIFINLPSWWQLIQEVIFSVLVLKKM